MDPDDPGKTPAAPPVVEVFFEACFLSEREHAPGIGVDHLLAALDTPLSEPITVEPVGPYLPVPHHDKKFSDEAEAVIQAACARSGCDLEHLTKDSLRAALLPAFEDRGA